MITKNLITILFICVLSIFTSSFSLAQNSTTPDESNLPDAPDMNEPPTPQSGQPTEPSIVDPQSTPYFATLNYAPLDLILPNKTGLSFGAFTSPKTSWEIEYLRAGDSAPFIIEKLGKVSEDRISILGRTYLGSRTFNLSWGLSLFDFGMILNDDLISRVPGTPSGIDEMKVQAIGINLGLSNRWKVNNNMILAIEWGSWSQPLFVTNNSSPFLDHVTDTEDKDTVKTAQKLIGYFPRFSLIKLHLGILF